MTSKPFSQPQNANKQPCKHPRVQIVSREEDAEFVECLECREVFEASELKDMSIEESAEGEAPGIVEARPAKAQTPRLRSPK